MQKLSNRLKSCLSSFTDTATGWLAGFGALLAALFAGLFRSVRNVLFGSPMPRVLDEHDGERIADHVVRDDDVEALERELELQRQITAMRLQRESVQVVDPRTEERWYKVVAPNGITESYACGTDAEARRYWEWAGDGYRVEQVVDEGRLMQLGLLCNLDGAEIRGAKIKRLDAEIASWREERTYGN